MIYAGIGLVLFAGVILVFALSESVTKARIQEMAEQFAKNPVLKNLEIKEDLLNGVYALDAWELNERIEAINLALAWQRKQSMSDATETPQDLLRNTK